MKIARYKGGIFGEGTGDILSCCLCGCQDYDELVVQRIGIAVGMAGDDYTFCHTCWYGPNIGRRILQFLGYPHGMFLQESSVDITEIDDKQ